MSNHDNPRRDETKRTEHGPRYESHNPGEGSNSTHVARGRKRWKTIATRASRHNDRLEVSGMEQEPVDDDYESMTDDDLDDAVHEAKGDEAADINNAGRDAQTAYLRGYESVEVPMKQLSEAQIRAIKALLVHSWTDIEFKYDGLTTVEKRLVSAGEFNAIVKWARDPE